MAKMIQRTMSTCWLLAFLIASSVQPVNAGGWTVVTLDQLPLNIQVGEPVEISFQVQQHGIHPLELGAGEVIVMARRQDSSEHIQAVAEATGAPGHYAAEIIFPVGGVWVWEVRPGGFPPAAMPDLTVGSGVVQAAVQMQPAPSQWEWWQQVAFQVITALRQPAEPAPVDLATDQVAYGKALFVAKGCVTCHVHNQVATQFSVEVGPNLTGYKVIPEYVTVWLKNPKAIKPATQMPQLGLSEQEIAALVAFLKDVQE